MRLRDVVVDIDFLVRNINVKGEAARMAAVITQNQTFVNHKLTVLIKGDYKRFWSVPDIL